MIDLLVKNVFNNTNRIDTIVKHINKSDKRYALMFALVTLNIYLGTKIMKQNKKKIDELETKLEEIKSTLA